MKAFYPCSTRRPSFQPKIPQNIPFIVISLHKISAHCKLFRKGYKTMIYYTIVYSKSEIKKLHTRLLKYNIQVKSPYTSRACDWYINGHIHSGQGLYSAYCAYTKTMLIQTNIVEVIMVFRLCKSRT
jgi:hypothetical protein